MITAAERAAMIAEYRGQSGPTGEAVEEHIVYQTDDSGRRVVILSTTRPATVADLLDTDRPVVSVQRQADYIRVTMDGDQYRPGGVVGALRRKGRDLTDEERAAMGERLRASLGRSA